MATQVKDRPAAKHDSFIQSQLDRAQRRIRFIDLTAGVLGLVAGTLTFAFLLMLLDRVFVLSLASRQVALLLYLIAAGIYVAYFLVRPLSRKVNPHYAARLLERTLDDNHNHVVNYVDLHEQKLPAVIRAALMQRTAKDLQNTDPDDAISPRRAFLAGGATGLGFILLVILFFLFGATQFRSLFARAFFPFFSGGIPSRTQVRILRPQDGDAVVTIGHPITIAAQVTGRIPGAGDKDAPCLLYRHDPAEPYRQRYLQADELQSEWTATIGPLDVHNGFTYKVTAGDDETPEYRVTVRAAPLIGDFLATYRYRKYVKKADQTRTTRNWKTCRTEVVILARTNRTIRDGHLILDPDKGISQTIVAEKVADDPGALRFRLVLDTTGKYRIRFTSTEGETYIDPAPHDLIAVPDNPPRVEISEPAKDVTLPANGHLEITGRASDDIGIARLELCLEIAGKKLKSRPYIADKLGTLDYGTPTVLDYRHLLELPTLLDGQGEKVELPAGTVIEYWLEATDGCDYPTANVGKSARWKITVADTKMDMEKEKKDLEAAKQREKEQKKKEEERLKEENQKREEQKKKDQERENQAAEERKKEQGGKGDRGENKQDDKGNEGKEPSPKDKRDQETRNTAERLQQEQEKREQGERGEGKDEKGKDGKKGEGKSADEKKDEGGKPGEGKGGMEGDGKASESKTPGESGKGNDKQPSSGKEPGKKDGKPGEARGPGKDQPGPKEKGERKPEDGPKPEDKVREGKPGDTEGKPAGESKPGQAPKDESKPRESKATPGQQGEKAGESKPGEQGMKNDKPGTSKPMPQPMDKTGDKQPGEAKAEEQGKRPQPKDAKPSDAKAAEKDLKSDLQSKRQKAADDLKEMAKNAEDPKTREEAQKALDEAKKRGDLDQDGKASPKAGDKMEDGKGEENEGQGPGKAGDKPEEQGEPKKGQGGPGKAKGREDVPPEGDNAGEGGDMSRRKPGSGGGGDDAPIRNDRPERHRASQTQLEKFKNIDPDILKKFKMSRDQYERFLRDYADLLKRQPPDDRPEVLPGPSRGGNLPASGGKVMKPTGDGKNDLRNEGRPKPPPGYGEAYNELLRRLNRSR